MITVPRMMMMEKMMIFQPKVVQIGNPNGKIALYLDKEEATDIAYYYGPSDLAYTELMKAISEAYPGELEENGEE